MREIYHIKELLIMKNASRGLSLAAVIVSAVNLVAALLHFLVAQSSQ
jgi:hypothetical protein